MDNSPAEKTAFLEDVDSAEPSSQSPTFSRYSAGTENRLIDEESLVPSTSKQGSWKRRDSLIAWAQSGWRKVRYKPRRALLLILCPILAVEFIYLMVADPSWTATLNQAGSKLGQQLPSYPSWLWGPGKASSPYGGDSDQTDKPIKRAMPIKSHLEFLKDDAKYLEAWVARGEVLPGLNFEKHDQIDGLWSWVNGSDPRHGAAREHFSKDPESPMLFPDSGTAARFRSSDELRYSLRSARAALGSFLRTSHVISTDFWPSGVPNDKSSGNTHQDTLPAFVTVTEDTQSDAFHVETGLVRYGQVPQWLDLEHQSVRVGDKARQTNATGPAPDLRMHHDWNTYTMLKKIVDETEAMSQPNEEELLAWKLRVLPTFNSMAMEASLGLNVTDLSDAFFYNCDDFYLGRNLSTADFSSPLYGPVFHIDHNTKVRPVEYQDNELGEHPSLRYSAWLLGERFGQRWRNYINHITKMHLRPLNQEAQLMFGDELKKTAGERFRGGAQLVNNHMLMYNFIMERHREALLWSYFVARVDQDGDGVYSDEELDGTWADLGLDTGMNLTISLPVRDTLHQDVIKENLNASQFSVPQETEYIVSSQDGYALLDLHPMRKTGEGWPAYDREPDETDDTKSDDDDDDDDDDEDLLNCWDTETGRDSVALFKHVAFEEPKCGDFLVAMLVAQSGRKGLSAFLPYEGASLPLVENLVDKSETTPHLPLNDRWQDGDFTLEGVTRNTGWSGMPRRIFAMSMIQRYAYTIGKSPNTFQMLTSIQSASNTLQGITKAGGSRAYAFMAINDDMAGPNVEEEQKMFQEWMEETWPSAQFKLPYERS